MMLIDVRFQGDDGKKHMETWEFTRRETDKDMEKHQAKKIAYFIDAVMLRDGKRVKNTDQYFPIPSNRISMDTFLDCFVETHYGKIKKSTTQYFVV